MKIFQNNINQSFSGIFKYDKIAASKAIAQLENTDVESLTPEVINGINDLKKRIEENTPDTFECSLDIKQKGKTRLYRDCFGSVFKKCSDIILAAKCQDTSNPNHNYDFKDVVKLRYCAPHPVGMHDRMRLNPADVAEKFDDFTTQIVNYATLNGSDRQAAVEFKPKSFAKDVYDKLD